MARERIHQAGFAPRSDARVRGRRRAMIAQLVTTLGLVLSIAVAATVVSIGIARADGIAGVAEPQTAHIAMAMLLAFLLAGMGGLTAVTTRDRRRVKPGR